MWQTLGLKQTKEALRLVITAHSPPPNSPSVALRTSLSAKNNKKGFNLGLTVQTFPTTPFPILYLPRQTLASFAPSASQGSYQGGANSTLLYQQVIYHAKTSGKIPFNHRSVRSKVIYPVPILQNAGRQQVLSCHSHCCLLHVNRHHRCLSSRPYTPQIPEIHRLQHQWRSIFLPKHAFRPKPQFPHLHHSCCSYFEFSAFPKNLSLYRRLAPMGTGPANSSSQTYSAFKTLSSLGFKINLTKSQFLPNSNIIYLDILWNGSNHSIQPAHKYFTKTSEFVTYLILPEEEDLSPSRVPKLLNFAAPLCR